MLDFRVIYVTHVTYVIIYVTGVTYMICYKYDTTEPNNESVGQALDPIRVKVFTHLPCMKNIQNKNIILKILCVL